MIVSPSISLWGAISAGPTGLSRALEMGCAIVKRDQPAVSLFISNVSISRESRVALNVSLHAMKRVGHQHDTDLCDPLKEMARHLTTIEKGNFASSVAFLCAGRELALFRYESIGNEELAYQRLRSEICSQLYRHIMAGTRLLPSGALVQLLREAILKRDEKAAKFLPALAGFYPMRFSRPHYQFMVDGLIEMPDGEAKNFVNLAATSLRRYFALEPIPPSVNP